MMKQPRFENSDTWILISISFYQGEAGTSLRDLIATADYINHAIPTDEEIEGGINRLAGAGLVTVEDDYFHLTPAARLLLREFHGKHASLFEIWEQVSTHLETLELPEVQAPEFKLKRGQSRAAYKSYYDLILDRNEKPKRKRKVATE